MTNPIIGFIGAGNMAISLIGGMLSKGYQASDIFACDPAQEQLDRLRNSVDQGEKIGLYNNSDQVAQADILILAVKPQILKQVCQELSPRLKQGVMVISIAAGIGTDSIQSWLGNLALVRCMPNTPALIQQGASGLYANKLTSAQQKQAAEDILNAVGIVHWVDSEQLLDVVTAVSGSGPAYYFLFTELIAEIGVEMGLPEQVAKALSVQTCLGAGMLAGESEDSLTELRKRVTSPGGTTHAAIERFQAQDLRALIKHAMQDCADRAEEMAKEFGD